MQSIIVCIILFGFCILLGSTRDYYIDNLLGNDTNNATSPEFAWKSISILNTRTFKGGDRILLARGRSWRGGMLIKSGAVDNPLIYDAYGEGDKPKILRSVSLSNESDWEQIGDSLWRTVMNITGDVGNIVFDHFKNESFKAYKVLNSTYLISDNQFCWDNINLKIIFRSTTNPAKNHESVEAALGATILLITASNVIIRNLNLMYSGAHGVQIVNSVNLTLTNLDISHIGGSYLGSPRVGAVRYGNGIELYASNRNIYIVNNTISQVYDTATTSQGGNITIVNDVRFENNYIHSCEQCYELWNSGPNTTSYTSNIAFIGNTCFGMGTGWSRGQRAALQGYDLLFYPTSANISSVTISNNLFVGAVDTSFWVLQPWNNFLSIFFDHNCFWPQAENINGKVIGRQYTLASSDAKAFNQLEQLQAYFFNFTSTNVIADPHLLLTETGQLVADPNGPCAGIGAPSSGPILTPSSPTSGTEPAESSPSSNEEPSGSPNSPLTTSTAASSISFVSVSQFFVLAASVVIAV